MKAPESRSTGCPPRSTLDREALVSRMMGLLGQCEFLPCVDLLCTAGGMAKEEGNMLNKWFVPAPKASIERNVETSIWNQKDIADEAIENIKDDVIKPFFYNLSIPTPQKTTMKAPPGNVLTNWVKKRTSDADISSANIYEGIDDCENQAEMRILESKYPLRTQEDIFSLFGGEVQSGPAICISDDNLRQDENEQIHNSEPEDSNRNCLTLKKWIQTDVSVGVSCPKCQLMIAPDDESWHEHLDFHYALELVHNEAPKKRKVQDASSKKTQGKKPKINQLTNYFK